MHRQSGGFFLSPSDVGVERYRSEDIVERMKPIDPRADDELLGFARVVSSLLEEPCDETAPMQSSANK